MQLSLTVLVGLLAGLCYSIPNPLPAPTVSGINDLDIFGWTPVPTQGPSMELMKKRGLYGRAATLSSGQLIGYFAPDTLCGYISGSIGAPVGCSISSRCAAVAPVGALPGAVGCCPTGGTGSCFFIETCYNSADIFVSSKCDAGCQQNSDAKFCTNSASPYCFGYTWSDISAVSWGCASQPSQSALGIVSFTFLGETDKRSWSAAYYTPTASGSTTNPLVTAQSSRTASTSTTTISSPATSTTAAAGGSKTNVGAIVGGVVGGLAVLGIFAFAIAFLLIRKRRNNNGNHPSDPAGRPVSVGPSPGMAVASPTAGHYAQEGKDGVYDHRYSTFSNQTTSPVPPYVASMQGIHPQQQQIPMEMEGHTPQGPGQQIYEAPIYPMSPQQHHPGPA